MPRRSDPYLAFDLSDEGLPIEERGNRVRLNLAVEECDLCAGGVDARGECDRCGHVRSD